MSGENQDKLMPWIVMGVCGLTFCFGVNLLGLVTPSKEEPNLNPGTRIIHAPTSIPGINAVAARAYGKNAWDCGQIRSNTGSINFNSECATKAWKKRKPFRLRFEIYDRSWGAYNGTLWGNKDRRLFLAVNYSSVNGIWKIEKEVKDAFIVTAGGKELLVWKEQKQDLGVNFPNSTPTAK